MKNKTGLMKVRARYYKANPLGVGVKVRYWGSDRSRPGGGIELVLSVWDEGKGVELRKSVGVNLKLGMSVAMGMAACLKMAMMEFVKLQMAMNGMKEPEGEGVIGKAAPPVMQMVYGQDEKPEAQMGIANPENEMGATRP